MLRIYTAYIFISERPPPYDSLPVILKVGSVVILNMHINNLALVIHSVEILNYRLLTDNLSVVIPGVVV